MKLREDVMAETDASSDSDSDSDSESESDSDGDEVDDNNDEGEAADEDEVVEDEGEVEPAPSADEEEDDEESADATDGDDADADADDGLDGLDAVAHAASIAEAAALESDSDDEEHWVLHTMQRMSAKNFCDVLEHASSKIKTQFCKMAVTAMGEAVKTSYLIPMTELMKADAKKRKEKEQHAVLNVKQGGLWTSEKMMAKVRYGARYRHARGTNAARLWCLQAKEVEEAKAGAEAEKTQKKEAKALAKAAKVEEAALQAAERAARKDAKKAASALKEATKAAKKGVRTIRTPAPHCLTSQCDGCGCSARSQGRGLLPALIQSHKHPRLRRKSAATARPQLLLR
jgi:hypothetical protein